MNLSDIRPSDIVAETKAAKTLMSNILKMAAWAEDKLEVLWKEYGETWAGLTVAQQDSIVSNIAEKAGVP